MSEPAILLYFSNQQRAEELTCSVLIPSGYHAEILSQKETLNKALTSQMPDVVIIELDPADDAKLSQVQEIINEHPALTVVLYLVASTNHRVPLEPPTGIFSILHPELTPFASQAIIEQAVQHSRKFHHWIHQQLNKNTRPLQKQINDLDALQRIGRTITSSLDLTEILNQVVHAAVNLTGADEGSLMLLDETNQELYIRAAQNIHEDSVRTLRVPVKDNLLGKILQEGKPVIQNEQTLTKIKTSLLVRALVYVPLMIDQQAIGVLGVHNRQGNASFSKYHLALLNSLSDYAAIAIKNIQQISKAEIERRNWESILTHVKDGVILLDTENQLVMINQSAQEAFNLLGTNLIGHPIIKAITHPELLEILKDQSWLSRKGYEIELPGDKIMNAQATVIPDVGLAIIMQDITHLKTIDRIKTDFVNNVSHDLRSPLTAILGYTELISRVGPVNSKQKEFIERVQNSVQVITALINDLLDLSRIEAGFDARKEVLSIPAIINFTVDSFEKAATDKSLVLNVKTQPQIPPVMGNVVRLRQMLANLISNAINYTPSGGTITVKASNQSQQVILQVIDNGPGIPISEQPHIFEKFYRGSNLPEEVSGTGLGLAIVKSIVEDHHGRIWVDSSPNNGTTFTIILPVANSEPVGSSIFLTDGEK